MHNIGITGTGSLIGQALIKCILNSEYSKEYKLIGFDYFPETVGSFWCNENYILPDLLKKGMEDIWIEQLIKIIKDEKIEVLFVGVDFELPLLAKNKQRIESVTGCQLVISSEKVIKIGNDKYSTYQFLKNNDLSYPETYLPENCDYSKLIYPVIVKPRVGARSIGVSLVNSLSEMEQALQLAKSPIIQECVGDSSTEYTCGVIAMGGGVKATMALKRTLKGGNTYLSEYKSDYPSVITDYLTAITEKLQPHGSCNYQLRMDKNGVPKMFEINPRHSGTTYMRSLFGYNEVIYILKYLLEGSEIVFDLKEGKAIRHYEEVLVK